MAKSSNYGLVMKPYQRLKNVFVNIKIGEHKIETELFECLSSNLNDIVKNGQASLEISELNSLLKHKIVHNL